MSNFNLVKMPSPKIPITKAGILRSKPLLDRSWRWTTKMKARDADPEGAARGVSRMSCSR